MVGPPGVNFPLGREAAQTWTGTHLEGEAGRQHLFNIVPLLLEDAMTSSESVGSQRKVVPAPREDPPRVEPTDPRGKGRHGDEIRAATWLELCDKRYCAAQREAKPAAAEQGGSVCEKGWRRRACRSRSVLAAEKDGGERSLSVSCERMSQVRGGYSRSVTSGPMRRKVKSKGEELRGRSFARTTRSTGRSDRIRCM